MRAILLVSLIALPAVARAGELAFTPLVAPAEVDPACRPLAVIPRDARTSGPALDAAISTASCMAARRASAVALTPTADSARELDATIAPALRILDRVIAVGDPARVIAALYMKSDLTDGNAVRIMNAVPRLSPQIGSKETYEHYKRVGVAEQATEPQRRRAASYRREIARVIAMHPELADKRDPVLAYMLVKTRIVDAAGIARR
jgi:hypothetical protein